MFKCVSRLFLWDADAGLYDSYIDGMQFVGGGLTSVCDIKNDVQRL